MFLVHIELKQTKTLRQTKILHFGSHCISQSFYKVCVQSFFCVLCLFIFISLLPLCVWWISELVKIQHCRAAAAPEPPS